MLAPTGTIAFMMDCDTTGVEPDIALVKYKKLVGGGMMKIVNQTVPRALRRLGYDRRRDRSDRRAHRRDRARSRARRAARRAPAGVRLRVPGRERRALDPPHGPHQDDGRRPAVHLRRHLQDGKPPERGNGRRRRRHLRRGLAARHQGHRHLPRRLEDGAAALDSSKDADADGRRRRARGPSAAR